MGCRKLCNVICKTRAFWLATSVLPMLAENLSLNAVTIVAKYAYPNTTVALLARSIESTADIAQL
jgi:hypothetical protein